MISCCCGLSSVLYHGWEGKCSELLATSSYSKIRGLIKEMMMMVMMMTSESKKLSPAKNYKKPPMSKNKLPFIMFKTLALSSVSVRLFCYIQGIKPEKKTATIKA